MEFSCYTLSMFGMNIFLFIFLCILALALSPFVLGFIFFFFAWLYLIFVCLTCSRHKPYAKPSRFYTRTFNFAYWVLLSCCRVKIHCDGKEKLDVIPKDKRFMLVSNHRSDFDNMIQCRVLKDRQLAYISKPQNFKIIMAGRFMNRCLYIPIERGNPREGIKAILKSIDYIKDGITSIGVFPEGKRSKTGELLEFKPGCFKIALKAKCPLVIGATYGTEKIHINFPWHTSHTHFDIIRVLQPEEYESMSTIELAELSKKLIAEHLQNL